MLERADQEHRPELVPEPHQEELPASVVENDTIDTAGTFSSQQDTHPQIVPALVTQVHVVQATQIGAPQELFIVSREEQEASVSKRSGDFSSADEFRGEEGAQVLNADIAEKLRWPPSATTYTGVTRASQAEQENYESGKPCGGGSFCLEEAEGMVSGGGEFVLEEHDERTDELSEVVDQPSKEESAHECEEERENSNFATFLESRRAMAEAEGLGRSGSFSNA